MVIGDPVRFAAGCGDPGKTLVMVSEDPDWFAGGNGGVGVVDFAGDIVRGHLVLKWETMQALQKSDGSGQVSLSM